MKYRIKWLLLILATAMGGGYAVTQAEGASLKKRGGKKIKPVKVYKYNGLLDMTADGRHLLFSQTKSPVQLGTIRSDGTASVKKSDTSADALRVVEFESGREIARKTGRVLGHFIPNTTQIYFKDENYNRHIWNYESDVTKLCIKREVGLSSVEFLNEKGAFGTVPYKINGFPSQLLVKLELPNCELRKLGDIYEPGLDPKKFYNRINYHAGITITVDKKQLLYLVRGKAVARNTSTLEIEKEFTATPLKLSGYASRPVFTSDGKYLILQAKNALNYKRGEKKQYFILIYDAKTYKKLNQFEVPGENYMTVTRDGRFIAVAYKTEKKEFLRKTDQAHIDLFDLKTGQKLAAMSHKRLRQKRNNPWRSDINNMMFTPDGKYLLTSTNDTYVWDISFLTRNIRK